MPALGALLVGSGVVAGWAGAAAAVVGVVLAVACRRFLRDAAPLVLASPLVLAGAAYIARPWGSSHGWGGELAWPQLCTVVALSSVCALASLEGARPWRRTAKRMKGSSTTR